MTCLTTDLQSRVAKYLPDLTRVTRMFAAKRLIRPKFRRFIEDIVSDAHLKFCTLAAREDMTEQKLQNFIPSIARYTIMEYTAGKRANSQCYRGWHEASELGGTEMATEHPTEAEYVQAEADVRALCDDRPYPEVLHLKLDGLTDTQIAAELGVKRAQVSRCRVDARRTYQKRAK